MTPPDGGRALSPGMRLSPSRSSVLGGSFGTKPDIDRADQHTAVSEPAARSRITPRLYRSGTPLTAKACSPGGYYTIRTQPLGLGATPALPLVALQEPEPGT